MQNDFSERTERGRAPSYLENDNHSLFSFNPKMSKINTFKDLILKGLLFEQFFPTKPGTQVQL